MKQFILLVIVATVIVACGPYQKAYKSTDPEVKLAVIDTLMNQGKYTKAVNLFEQIVNTYRGTDKAEDLAIKYAKALYETKDYVNASYQYERFVNSHPTSENREFAMFMAAKIHYKMSNIYSKDQRDTDRALAKLQSYIDVYPNGEFLGKANDMVGELRLKLDKKAYEIAKNYHHREKYIPAIRAFENFMADYPGSAYLDDALFYLMDSQYNYAVKSTDNVIVERLDKAIKYYTTFVARFPDSEYIKDADKIKKQIEDFKLKNNS